MMTRKKKEIEKPKEEFKPTKTMLPPVDLQAIGSDQDPCFGKGYDLTTNECKICGDSELCCIKFAALTGKTRKQLEAENNYKDMDILYDQQAVKKTVRQLCRKGLERKEIMDRLMAKYTMSRQDARSMYKKYKPTTN